MPNRRFILLVSLSYKHLVSSPGIFCFVLLSSRLSSCLSLSHSLTLSLSHLLTSFFEANLITPRDSSFLWGAKTSRSKTSKRRQKRKGDEAARSLTHFCSSSLPRLRLRERLVAQVASVTCLAPVFLLRTSPADAASAGIVRSISPTTSSSHLDRTSEPSTTTPTGTREPEA